MDNNIKTINNIRKIFIFSLCVFVYAFGAMFFSREFIIPKTISSIGGHITGDPFLYHSIALEKLHEIKTNGIGKFEFHPKGQGPAGITSMFYSIWENPYAIVLLNSVLHAISAVIMVLILIRWFPLFISIIATLPLVISPYMIVWYSQINKDSFSLAGGLIVLYGILKLVNPIEKNLFAYNSWVVLFYMVIGVTFTWISRPYVNQIILPIICFILIINFIYRVVCDGFKWRWFIFLFQSGLIVVFISLMGRGASSDATLESFHDYALRSIDSQGEEFEGREQKSAKEKCLTTIDKYSWQNEDSLPIFINSKLKAIMGQRCLQLTWKDKQDNEAVRNSYIDYDVYPRGSIEALAYLPRAALIGLFTPWPEKWFYNLKSYKISVFYIIVPIETFLLYIGLFGLSIWIIRSKSWGPLIPIFLCVSVITIYGMATPLVGTLYRYRYPWWIVLICLGMAASLELLRYCFAKRSDSAKLNREVAQLI